VHGILLNICCTFINLKLFLSTVIRNHKNNNVLLMLESVRIETTNSRGCKSPCVFIEVVLLFTFS
jgi:hypothetical protein